VCDSRDDFLLLLKPLPQYLFKNKIEHRKDLYCPKKIFVFQITASRWAVQINANQFPTRWNKKEMHTITQAYTHKHAHNITCAHAHTHTHTHAHTQTHARAHARTHTHTHQNKFYSIYQQIRFWTYHTQVLLKYIMFVFFFLILGLGWVEWVRKLGGGGEGWGWRKWWGVVTHEKSNNRWRWTRVESSSAMHDRFASTVHVFTGRYGLVNTPVCRGAVIHWHTHRQTHRRTDRKKNTHTHWHTT
jgi:hypothetical protein